MSTKLRAAIIVVSDTASKDALTDKCIPALREVFQQDGGDRWETAQTKIIADDVSAIQNAITGFTDGADSANLVVTSGGTGFAQKDVTPEVSSRRPVIMQLHSHLLHCIYTYLLGVDM
jgi:gephyrin